jgi:hypothetical protein
MDLATDKLIFTLAHKLIFTFLVLVMVYSKFSRSCWRVTWSKISDIIFWETWGLNGKVCTFHSLHCYIP